MKKLTRPNDEEEDFFDEDDEDMDIEPEPVRAAPRVMRTERRNPFAAAADASFDERPAPKKEGKVVNINTAGSVQVVVAKPERFEQAAEIANHLRDKRSVLMNLENTNREVALRLVDFLSGVTYANDGKIKKVAASTYILTPFNVDIIGDLLDELGNNGISL